jgi:transcriptional regulator
MLEKMVDFYESGSTLAGKLREKPYEDMMSGIVGFKIHVDRIRGKAKLSQNHTVEDRMGVIDHLSRSSNQDKVEIAKLIGKTIKNQ